MLGTIRIPYISNQAKWIQNGITVAGGNGQGPANNQLSGPVNMYVDEYETVCVAEYFNHRVIQWEKNAVDGQAIAGGNGAGNGSNQLNNPRKVVVDKQNQSLIICDTSNRRVVRWPRQNGAYGETVIIDIACAGVAMDNDGYLYVSDIQKHEVRRWKIGERDGTLVAGGNGPGNGLNQLNTPYHIFVDQDQSVYVSDHANHRVVK